jgi:ubiquinone/menaquinone biosynthesis C-methylase UbiE
MSHGHGGSFAEGVLVAAMWSYASTVLYPSQALRRAGLLPRQLLGDLPASIARSGQGPLFSRRQQAPVLLGHPTEHDHLVEEFDRMAEVYDAFVRPFSTPIFDEALDEMRGWLPPDARALDTGCGAGRELQRVARLVPDGEVVGVDLSAGMVQAAWRDAAAHGLGHCAFFQADVGRLPAEFEGAFDIVYNCLAHHHYPDPAAATREVHRVLRPGGVYAVIDPGPAWFNVASAPLARWADPGWIRFHTPDEFRRLFADAGFDRTGSLELLPGFNLNVAQKRV